MSLEPPAARFDLPRLSRTTAARAALVAASVAATAFTHGHAWAETASTPAPTSAAPSGPGTTMSLAEAEAYALAHHPTLAVARARVREAVARADIPGGQWLPQVGAVAELFAATSNNSSAATLTDRTLDVPRVGGTPAGVGGTFTPYASSFVGVGARQLLVDFGRVAAQRAALDRLTELESASADLGRLDVLLDVRRAYFAVLGAKEVVSAADAAYTRAKAHRDAAKAGVDNKLRAPIELLRSEAELARFDVERVRAAGNLDYARAVLAAVIGVNATAVDANGVGALPAEPSDVAQALDRAASLDPALRAALAAAEAQRATSTAIAAELRPSIFASGSLTGRAGGAPVGSDVTPVGSGFLPVVPNWDVGLVLSWPIFDGTVQRRVDASRAAESTLAASVDARRFQQITEVRRAFAALAVAKSTIPALERARDVARLHQTQVEAAYAAGLSTSLEVADAEALLAEAEYAVAEGNFNRARAHAALARSMGE
jgi:outer membrane protein